MMNIEEVTSVIFFSTVEIKDYNIMIYEKKIYDQPVKNDLMTYGSTRKIAAGQGDDNITDCLPGYNHFKNYYKMIAIGLSKQQALDADPKAIQQNNFTANVDQTGFYRRNYESIVILFFLI